ncbi:DUF3574 domain-containing protein [Streptomyces sp. NPDC050548]|uniref:DUF3574 domain-containing protein n=1 Tax=Streptomyces sp. NPDC050548 TaxID=3365629 RepID=UPI0037B77049
MAFVDKEVTPDFPAGLTVQSGRGRPEDRGDPAGVREGLSRRSRWAGWATGRGRISDPATHP